MTPSCGRPAAQPHPLTDVVSAAVTGYVADLQEPPCLTPTDSYRTMSMTAY